MKFDMNKGYWDNKPMREQLECIAEAVDFPVNAGVLNPLDMEGLIKAGVRFPEIEDSFEAEARLKRYLKFKDECKRV